MERPVPTPRITIAAKQLQTPLTLSSPSTAASSSSGHPSPLDVEVPVQKPPLTPRRKLFARRGVDDDDTTSSSGESSGMSSPGSIRIQCTQMVSSVSTDSGDDEGETMLLGSRQSSKTSHDWKPGKEREKNGSAVEWPRAGNEYLIGNIVSSSGMHSPSIILPSEMDRRSVQHVPPLAVSLLEQLVRTHPIWYLQDTDRTTVEHYLHSMPPGTFIVRGCSRPSSMALSIRLPPTYMPCEVDHLLLVHAVPSGLRLHSSPHVFRSLPLLIEYYCGHKEELRVILRLPEAITDCRTTTALQGIALMGIEFWSSPLCMRRGSMARSSLSSTVSSSDGGGTTHLPLLLSPRGMEGGNSRDRDYSCPAPRGDRRLEPRRSESSAGHNSERGDRGGTASAKSSLGKSSGSSLVRLLQDSKETVASQLAHCALFLPFRRNKPTSSRSAMNVRDWREQLGSEREGWGRGGREWTANWTTFKPNRHAVRDHSTDDRLNSAAARRMAEHAAAAPNASFSSGTPALRPPADAFDPINTKQCVDELRRKRLQSTQEMLGAMTQDECSSVLRRKKSDQSSLLSRSSKRIHRLSAPSLPDPPNSAIMETAKALKERMERNQDGELSTINEGLITPVVRRKVPFMEKQQTVPSEDESSEPLLLFNRAFQSDRPRQPRAVETPVITPPTVVKPVPVPVPTVTVAGGPAPIQWSAVTKELRSRQQKIAKVLPTPQTPRVSAEQRMTIRDSVTGGNCRMPSEYAQLTECADAVNGNTLGLPREDDCVSVAATEFDEPWDSNTWENLLVCAGEGDARVLGQESIVEEDEDGHLDDSDDLTPHASPLKPIGCNAIMSPRPASRAVSRHSLLSMDPSGSLRRPARMDSASQTIQQYIAYLASAGGTFSNSLDKFIECTHESTEKDARLVAKNVRQFINGMKNYLMKQGEGELHAIIARESARLDQNSVLNMDTILEDSLNRLVLKPLSDHIYTVLRSSQRYSGSLIALFANVEKAKQMTPQQMGLGPEAVAPSADLLDKLRGLCKRMQLHYSPHRKLELLLKATRLIFAAQHSDKNGEKGGVSEERDDVRVAPPPANELVAWLVWLMARTLNVACECEAIYMSELLPTQFRHSGDGAFYLSALDSAVRVLSSPGGLARLGKAKEREGLTGGHIDSATDCLIRVAVPDELAGCVHFLSFPVQTDTTSTRLCRLVAHQHAITNPEDYGLYLVTDGFESCLAPSDGIESLRTTLHDKPFLLAYKRHEARLAWPALSTLKG